ncbi:hypothetical protein DFH28DRAFT_492418 [Melampsora americana]|nr:hypothetical protein DFH28DRAFT_492418 [Melampsora americana]
MRFQQIVTVLNLLLDYHICVDIHTISSIHHPTTSDGFFIEPTTAPKFTVKYPLIHEQYLRRTKLSDQLQAQVEKQYRPASTTAPPSPIPQSPARRLGHFDDREDATPPDVQNSESSQEVLTPTEPVPASTKILGIDVGILAKGYYGITLSMIALFLWESPFLQKIRKSIHANLYD